MPFGALSKRSFRRRWRYQRMSIQSVLRLTQQLFNGGQLSPQKARQLIAAAGTTVVQQERDTIEHVTNALLGEVEQNLSVRIRRAGLTMSTGQARRAVQTDPGLAIQLGFRSAEQQREIAARCQAHALIEDFLARHPARSLPSLYAQSAATMGFVGGVVGGVVGGGWGAFVGAVAGVAAGLYTVSQAEELD